MNLTTRGAGWLGVLCLLVLGGFSSHAQAQAQSYSELRDRAEALFARGDFAGAHQIYQGIATNTLAPADQRWVVFRRDDTGWRLRDAANLPAIEEAAPELSQLGKVDLAVDQRDRVWAEAQESLGDFHLRRGEPQDWTSTRYQAALGWWGGQTNLNLARDRYLELVFKMETPPTWPRRGGSPVMLQVPDEILQRAVSIAQRPEDVAPLRLMQALRGSSRRDPLSIVRTEQDFARALSASEGLPGRDVVLWFFAQWRERSGRWTPLAEGRWQIEADPAGAVTLYRQLVAEFGPGRSRWRGPAEARLRDLTNPSLSVGVDHVFLPDSEIEVWLQARNVKQVEFTLRALELGKDLKLPLSNREGADWKSGYEPTGPVVDEFVHTVEAAPHVPVRKTVRFPRRLAPGAYLLQATAGGQTDREIVLVSDTGVVVEAGGGRLTAWVTGATDGRPRSEVPVWVVSQNERNWVRVGESQTTDGRGLTTFALPPQSGRLLVLAGTGAQQAWAEVWAGMDSPESADNWRIYAITDRPAYRPGETLEWKLTARKKSRGVYQTPAGARLRYAIQGPQGNTVTNGVVTLSRFGSAWGRMALESGAALGMYSIHFETDDEREESIGDAQLFRLEEYRLPEFEVTVTPPEEPAPGGGVQPKRLRSGERITVVVSARFYHGSPVVGGTAEVVVRRRPFGWYWPRPMEFSWWMPPVDSPWERFGPAQVVERRTVVLDAAGKAEFTFDPGSEAGNAEYPFDVAVTDASRREVRASRTLRATEQGYSVMADPKRKLPRPGEAAVVEFRSKDANDHPVAVTGDVVVSREVWWEVWLDSFGREFAGEELKKKRAESPVWPPPVAAGMKEWTLKSQGYRSERLVTQRVVLGTNGVGELRFTPDREGYYRVVWDSPDVWAIPGATQAVTNRIRAECALWATGEAGDLAYRGTELELIVDRESFRVGERVPVMVAAAQPGRWVWMVVDAAGTGQQEVFQMSGTTRMVMLDVTEAMVPNFQLKVSSVLGGSVMRNQADLVVAPVRQFLQVDVLPETAENRPGGVGKWTLQTRDWEGNPVSAEVSLAVVDESVFYIQPPLAPDPREFFFGERRPVVLGTASSFDRGAYRRLMAVREDARPEGDGDGEQAGAGGRGFGRTELALGEVALMDRMMITGSKMVQATPMVTGMAAAVAGAEPPAEAAVVVRRDFRATAYWKPDVRTDASGRATVEFRYPDSTTRWQATAVAATAGNQFGQGTNAAVTRSPLMVRLQTPRFLITGDVAVISANVNNATDRAQEVQVALNVRGATPLGRWSEGRLTPGSTASVTVPPGGEQRVDWQVRAESAGDAVFTVTGRSATESDGMERTVPVVEYGLEQLLARSGATSNEVTVEVNLPARRSGPLEFSVGVTPSLATSMLDALPYLAAYPYGCTEQTLSRFLPAVVVRRTLSDLGLDAETVMSRAFGGISTNAAGGTAPGLGARRDLLKLDDMVAAGLQRLMDFQHDNGAWGWWAEGPDDAWMTAYVVWGLRLAEAAGVKVDADRLTRADRWLVEHLVDLESSPDRLAWGLHALAMGRVQPGQPAAGELERRAWDRLWPRRAELNAYSQALLALSAHRFGFAEQARALAAALSASAVRQEDPATSLLYGTAATGGSTLPTAHWGRTDRNWLWSENGVEATAMVVRALMAISPEDSQADAAVMWLLKNRRGASWSNTRSTAISVLALTDYLQRRRPQASDVAFEVVVNGRSLARRAFQPEEFLGAPVRVSVPESLAVSGTNRVTIRRTGGQGPLYFAVEARFFSQERPIPPAAADLFVRRDYFRLVPVPTLLEGVVDQRVPLRDGDPVSSGDRLEARVVIETPNDLEYLLIEDLKPAGLEAVEVQSGYRLEAFELTPAGIRRLAQRPGDAVTLQERTGRSESLYVEWRDRRAALFAARLPAGGWEIRVPYRAETPGRFSALPAVGEAMYAPEVRGNASSRGLEVRETPR